MNKQPLSAERARALFSYDPETGQLRRKNPGNIQRFGELVGKPKKYHRVDLGDKRYSIHRLIWLMQTGSFPAGLVDHINGDRGDNRWCNLRECDPQTNTQNQRRAHKDSITGLLGTFPFRGGFRAAIAMPSGKKKLIGTFNTSEEAHQAYLVVKRQLHLGCTI